MAIFNSYVSLPEGTLFQRLKENHALMGPQESHPHRIPVSKEDGGALATGLNGVYIEI